MHFWGYIRVQRAHIWAVCATWNLSFTASHRSQLKKNCYRVIKKDCNGVRLSVGFWDSVLNRGITMPNDKGYAVRPTRFEELGFTSYCGIWRIVARDTGNVVGPVYKTKMELFSDLARYAKDYGCEAA